MFSNFKYYLPAKMALTNNAYLDPTASEEAEAVWFWSALFAFLTSILWIQTLMTYIILQSVVVQLVEH